MSEIRMVIWLNLIIGLYNMYLFGIGDNWFNFIIGSINIGVWVFYRGEYNE
tara:strand:- start:218 stop:370 length:153 start_codon:yes stop_codon:yes gene_type:complete